MKSFEEYVLGNKSVFDRIAVRAVVLIKRAGGIGVWCVVIAFVIPIVFKAFAWIENKIPTNQFFEEFKNVLSGGDGEKIGESLKDGICEEPDKYDVSPAKRIYKSVVVFFIMLAIISTIAMSYLGIFQTHYNSYYNVDVSYSERYITNEDMHEYEKIESKYWKTLNVDSRLEILQKIAEHEAERLGLPEVPTVVTAEFYNKDYNVNYNAEENLIELDLNMVKYNKSGYKAVKALANGAYYAYEEAKKQLVKAINSDEATSKYSNLAMFWDTNRNNQLAFEKNALKYSEYVQSEFRRKIMLFKFDGNKEYY